MFETHNAVRPHDKQRMMEDHHKRLLFSIEKKAARDQFASEHPSESNNFRSQNMSPETRRF